MSSRTVQFSLLGPQAAELLSKLGVDAQALAAKGHGSHSLLGLSGKPVVVAVGGGLVPGEGFTLVADEAIGGDLWRALSGQVGWGGGGGELEWVWLGIGALAREAGS